MGFFRYALSLQPSLALQYLGTLYLERGGKPTFGSICYFTAQPCLIGIILTAPRFELMNYEDQTLQGNLASPSVEQC